MRECGGAAGGPCNRLIALLDSAERMFKSKVRTGKLSLAVVHKWLEEREGLCEDCPGRKPTHPRDK